MTTLNLCTFIKALEVVQVGLADVEVKTGHRLALEQRAQKICRKKQNSNLKKYLAQIKLTELKEPHIVCNVYIYIIFFLVV